MPFSGFLQAPFKTSLSASSHCITMCLYTCLCLSLFSISLTQSLFLPSVNENAGMASSAYLLLNVFSISWLWSTGSSYCSRERLGVRSTFHSHILVAYIEKKYSPNLLTCSKQVLQANALLANQTLISIKFSNPPMR